ncbi:hypothetical protein R6L23_10895 [Streptomyces sp. SR27]|uniref:hypothetical protein n=1 Tax=Streptomyces sp. SR27 TaxID=3076630 RepID=UPI00295B7ABC|nr:hypothetical protein [Streptomyces sp. SR27]MDV9188716.1 hypothetical protein [Streptomyces sp. SR27]
MRQPIALRIHAALATLALTAATGVVLSMPQASAATGGVTGYAPQNGGTTGGAGGQTVRATTGTAIHTALCNRASSSTPITIAVEGAINHANTAKVSGPSCDTANPAGPDPQSNTTVAIPYAHTLDPAACVPDVVGRTTAARRGLQVSDGNCSPQTPAPTTPTPSSPAPTTPTPSPASGPIQPGGTNLGIGADSDGSSKADGTSSGKVRDADPGTCWPPAGPTGSVSIKWGTATTVSVLAIREATGSGAPCAGPTHRRERGASAIASRSRSAPSSPTAQPSALSQRTPAPHTALGLHSSPPPELP